MIIDQDWQASKIPGLKKQLRNPAPILKRVVAIHTGANQAYALNYGCLITPEIYKWITTSLDLYHSNCRK